MEWCELYGRFLVVKLERHAPIVFDLKKILQYSNRSQGIVVNAKEIISSLKRAGIRMGEEEAIRIFETSLHEAKVIYPCDVKISELSKKYGIPEADLRGAWDGVEIEEEEVEEE